MQLYNDELERLVMYFSKGNDSREKEIWEDYEEILFNRKKLKVRPYNTHLALRHCKNFEEIAEKTTKDEKKKITPDGIRKRAENAMTTIEKFLREKYENKKHKTSTER